MLNRDPPPGGHPLDVPIDRFGVIDDPVQTSNGISRFTFSKTLSALVMSR